MCFSSFLNRMQLWDTVSKPFSYTSKPRLFLACPRWYYCTLTSHVMFLIWTFFAWDLTTLDKPFIRFLPVKWASWSFSGTDTRHGLNNGVHFLLGSTKDQRVKGQHWQVARSRTGCIWLRHRANMPPLSCLCFTFHLHVSVFIFWGVNIMKKNQWCSVVAKNSWQAKAWACQHTERYGTNSYRSVVHIWIPAYVWHIS